MIADLEKKIVTISNIHIKHSETRWHLYSQEHYLLMGNRRIYTKVDPQVNRKRQKSRLFLIFALLSLFLAKIYKKIDQKLSLISYYQPTCGQYIYWNALTKRCIQVSLLTSQEEYTNTTPHLVEQNTPNIDVLYVLSEQKTLRIDPKRVRLSQK